MKNIKMRRILTFIFTLTFIFSTVMGTLPAFASPTTKENLVTRNDTDWVAPASPDKENILLGKEPYLSVYHSDAGTVKAEEQNPTGVQSSTYNCLTDGKYSVGGVDSEYRVSYCKFAVDDNGTVKFFDDGVKVYQKIAYDLGKSYDISDIMVAHSKTNNMATGLYKLYVSDNKDTLFDDSNLVANVDNTTTKAYQQVVSTKEGETLSGQYVGMYVLLPTSRDVTSADNVYLRIQEISVYTEIDFSSLPTRGTVNTLDEEATLPTLDTANDELNISEDVVPQYFKNTDGSYVDISESANGGTLDMLTDGDLTADFQGYAYSFGATVGGAAEFYNNKSSVALTFNLGKAYNLTKLTLINHATDALATRHYMVYASSNKADLYDKSNFVAEVNNTNGKQRNIITFNSDVKAQYVGISVWDPCTDYNDSTIVADPGNAYLRLNEVAVYGKEIEMATYTATNVDTYETDTSLGETSIIAGKTAAKVHYVNTLTGKDDYRSGDTLASSSALTDGNMGGGSNEWRESSGEFWVEEGNKYINSGIEIGDIKTDVIFNLGGTHEITGFEVFNATNNEGVFATRRYQIYIGDDMDNLFTADNLVVDYTNEEPLKACNRFALTQGKTARKGKVFAIRILDPTYSKAQAGNTYPRIRELTLYGKRIVTEADAVIMDNDASLPTHFSGTNIATQSSVTGYAQLPGEPYGKCQQGETAKLTDGDPSSSSEYLTSSVLFADSENNKWIGNGLNEGDVYQDLVFDLNYISNLSGLVLINHKTVGMRTKKYEIYFADTKEELFQGTPLKVVENTNASQRNMFDLNYLNNGNDVKARFVGIRVLDATCYKPNPADLTQGAPAEYVAFDHLYLRLLEVAIYGTLTDQGGDPPPDYNVLEDDTLELPNWGSNIALGMTPKIYARISGEYKTNGSNKNLVQLTDGDVGTEAEQQQILVDVSADGQVYDHTSYGDGAWYTDFVFDYHTEVDVDGIAIIHHSNVNFITRHYKIYVGSDIDTLFTDGNLVREVTNSSAYRRNAYNIKGSEGQSRKGRFVAVRVLAPTDKANSGPTDLRVDKDQNRISTRLMEIAIYGDDHGFVYEPPFTAFKTTPDLSYWAGNLLLGRTMDECIFIGQSMKSFATPHRGGIITDGAYTYIDKDENDIEKEGHYDFGSNFAFTQKDGSQYADFIWDMKDNYNFTKFAMLSSIIDISSHYTGWYRLYISDDYDLLFDDSSIAFEYNAIKDKEADDVCRGQEVNFKTPVYGRYVAIRILYPVIDATSWVRPRVVEVGLWGEKAEIDLSPTNLTGNMPVTAYLGNIESLQEVSTDNFSLSEISKLADGNATTGAAIKTGGKKLSIVYNLCQDVEVYSILVNSLAGKTALKNYKIYASDSQQGVWNDSALVYTHSGSGATGEKNFTITKQYRFVRVEIESNKDTVYIGDVLVMGPTASLLKYKNLIKNIEDINYNYYLQDVETGKITSLQASSAGISSTTLHDGSTAIATNINGGIEGKSTMDILIDIGDLKSISELKLHFPKRSEEYKPTGLNIYFGETDEELESLDAVPDQTYKGVPSSRVLTFNFVPVTARYIRISFVSANENYGREEMIVALTEIEAFGTAVYGMNLGQENVLEFEDKKLGIKWGIKRGSPNDVINNIATSKVIVGKATNWQKRSLEKIPYLEIVDGKTYTFKFYDIAGKEVTDLGGREVEIAIKIRGDMTSGTAMLGYSGNKWYVEVYESDGTKYEDYVVTTADGMSDDITFSLLNMISSTDEYWSTIGELEDYGDEEPEYAPTTEEDKTTSTATIVTEDGDFHINPQGALRLPVDAQLIVSYTTYTLTQEVYDALLPIADPNYLAATYYIDFYQGDMEYMFDGTVEIMAKIPDVLKGYFSSYKLVHIYDNGYAEFVDYTLDGDYIFFETTSLSKFALIGEGYSPDGDAVLTGPTDTPADNIIDTNLNQDGTNDGTDNEGAGDGYYDDSVGESPVTGESSTIYYVLASIISLAAIVLLNSKKFNKVR